MVLVAELAVSHAKHRSAEPPDMRQLVHTLPAQFGSALTRSHPAYVYRRRRSCGSATVSAHSVCIIGCAAQGCVRMPYRFAHVLLSLLTKDPSCDRGAFRSLQSVRTCAHPSQRQTRILRAITTCHAPVPSRRHPAPRRPRHTRTAGWLTGSTLPRTPCCSAERGCREFRHHL